jgi:hypothetical protein
MSSPRRCIFQDNIYIALPEVNEVTKTVALKYFKFRGHADFEESYDTGEISLYMAPDLILSYTNGNTTKDEFCRYQRWKFVNLRLESKAESKDGEYATYVYSYAECIHYGWIDLDDPDFYANIPVGKFAGMNSEDIANYKKENIFSFIRS